MKKLLNSVLRFIYYRNVSVLGWPSRRSRAVWWLYELKIREHWRDVADKLEDVGNATKAWLAALEREEK